MWTLLGWGPAYAAEQVSKNSVPPLEEKVGFTEGVPRDPFLSLREVIRRFSQRTGIAIRLSQELQVDDKALRELYFVRDDSWLEQFSRMEIHYQETGEKEIILLKSHSLNSSRDPNQKKRASRVPIKTQLESPQGPSRGFDPQRHEARKLPLPLEKLQKLVKGPYRSPLPVNMYEDPEFRAFFAQFGINSPQDLQDRKKAKKIRKAARRWLYQMRSN